MQTGPVALALTLALSAAAAGAQDGGRGAVETQLKPLLEKFVANVEAMSAYTVVMTKQQRIGKGLKPAETLLLKHRRNPECRYMKWLEEPHKNREVITCKDRDGGKLKVHQPGMLGVTLSLSPDNSMITSGNLRPIDQSGVFNMARVMKAEAPRREAEARTDPSALPTLSERDVNGQPSLCLHRAQGATAGEDKAPYKVGATELCFEKIHAMPTGVQFWDDAGRLMEHYSFRDYHLDAPLTDLDFDTRNPDYQF